MNNYMKTIISGLKQWVSAQITKSKSDWNQNDPNAENYIKNRTHYTYQAEVVLLPTTSFTENDQGGLGLTQIDGSSFVIEYGKEYKVTFDGKTYSCVGYTDTSVPGCVLLGNFTIVEALAGTSGHIDTGEPFILMHMATYGVLGIYTPVADAHTIAIACISETVKKIDEKYLPDMNYVNYKEYQDLTESQMQIARNNIGAGTSDFSGYYSDLINTPTIYTDVVRYGTTQSLSDANKEQARSNIGAGTSNFSGSYNDLTDIPDTAQANWAQNDSTQPDYIVGRTHYVGPVESELLNNIAASTVATGDNVVAYWHAGLDLTFENLPLNEDTIIKFIRTDVVSGPLVTEVEGKVSHYSNNISGNYDYYVVGNQSLLNGIKSPAFQVDFGAHEDTGETYAVVIEVYSNEGVILDDYPRVYVLSKSTWGSKRFKIYLINDSVVQLDEKFIPDSIVRTSEIEDIIAAIKELCLPKVTSITLYADDWMLANGAAYYQDVVVSCVTPTSKVDLQPTYTQLAEWQNEGLAFTTVSANGAVRVWATDGTPREDLTVQITVQEVLEV